MKIASMFLLLLMCGCDNNTGANFNSNYAYRREVQVGDSVYIKGTDITGTVVYDHDSHMSDKSFGFDILSSSGIRYTNIMSEALGFK